MRITSHRNEQGYSILEALIACSLTMMAAAGITKLSGVAQGIASRAYIEVTAQCERPACSKGISRVTCVCDTDSYTVIP
jgi:F0F1-type ATP synthase membrane subunit c/vacuolar-type H+-ATPase subunit K